MTQPPQPPNVPWQPPPPVDASSRTLKLSGAALIWVIIGVMVFCLVGPIASCFLCGFGGLLSGSSHSVPTPTP